MVMSSHFGDKFLFLRDNMYVRIEEREAGVFTQIKESKENFQE